MLARTGRLFSSLLLCFFLLTLVAACGDAGNKISGTIVSNGTATSQTTSVQSPGTTTTPAGMGTHCPAPGTSRAAKMPALHLGTRQEIIYYHNINNQAVLDLFDVNNQSVTAITGLTGGQHIQGAQVSADGQWVLMIVDVNGISEFQLVRIDGKFLQTLYCVPAGQPIDPSAQWSLDQKRVLFAQGNAGDPPRLLLMRLTGGPVQVELGSPTAILSPVTWLDNTRIYVKLAMPPALYLLDTNKGAGQHMRDMQQIKGSDDQFWDFDTSLDGRTLYTSTRMAALTANPGSLLDVTAIDGSGARQLLLSHTLVVVAVRVIDASHLLLVSYTRDNTTRGSYNGFWKIHTDGSGLTRLNNDPGGAQWGPLNPYGQYTWSNFSRNGEFYTDGLYYGPLTGGSLTRYAADGDGDGNVLVGWAIL